MSDGDQIGPDVIDLYRKGQRKCFKESAHVVCLETSADAQLPYARAKYDMRVGIAGDLGGGPRQWFIVENQRAITPRQIVDDSSGTDGGYPHASTINR